MSRIGKLKEAKRNAALPPKPSRTAQRFVPTAFCILNVKA
jgi:hypothetical protein